MDDDDSWKHEQEEPEFVPPVIVQLRGLTPEKDYVEALAVELLNGHAAITRKNVEAYMTVRDDPKKAINFLQTMLEADDMDELDPNQKNLESTLPPLTDEEKADRYRMPIRDLEELFELDMWCKAVELLRTRGQ